MPPSLKPNGVNADTLKPQTFKVPSVLKYWFDDGFAKFFIRGQKGGVHNLLFSKGIS